MSLKYPVWVCHPCGSRYQTKPDPGRCSTYHQGVCEVCGKEVAVTEPRDFGYPDFSKEPQYDSPSLRH